MSNDPLVDSDAFVGRMYPDDIHHQRAKHIFKSLEGQGKLLVTTSLVIGEAATVLSHRKGQSLARSFLELIEKARLPVIHVTEDLQEEAISIFKKQDTRGTSATDCANVAVARRFYIPTIFGFDKVYPKSFGLELVSD